MPKLVDVTEESNIKNVGSHLARKSINKVFLKRHSLALRKSDPHMDDEDDAADAALADALKTTKTTETRMAGTSGTIDTPTENKNIVRLKAFLESWPDKPVHILKRNHPKVRAAVATWWECLASDTDNGLAHAMQDETAWTWDTISTQIARTIEGLLVALIDPAFVVLAVTTYQAVVMAHWHYWLQLIPNMGCGGDLIVIAHFN